MHMCCANCSIYPIQLLSSKGMTLKGLWFNPNIHPEDEYTRRLDTLKSLETLWNLDVEYSEQYGRDDFERAIRKHSGLRCEVCYAMRLGETARTAKKMGLDGFTTTLLVSPYQKFDLIVRTGERMQKEYGIAFYAEDFRSGWKEGVRISRELGLYRQNYCGCIYSKLEREEQRKRKNAERLGTYR